VVEEFRRIIVFYDVTDETSTSVLVTVRSQCMLIASHAAPWWVMSTTCHTLYEG